MSKEKAVSKNKISIIDVVIPIILCLLFSIIAIITSMSVFSFILSNNELITLIPIFSLASLFIGCIVCGMFNSKFFPKDKIVTSIICGVMIALILFILNIFIFKSSITYVTYIKYFLCVIICVLSSLTIKKDKKSKRKH